MIAIAIFVMPELTTGQLIAAILIVVAAVGAAVMTFLEWTRPR